MNETRKRQKVLVIGSLPDFHTLVGKPLEDRFDVIYAASEAEGLSKARVERPKAIVLGYLDPRGSAFRLYKKLREGWITKHIPQLVADVQLPGPGGRDPDRPGSGGDSSRRYPFHRVRRDGPSDCVCGGVEASGEDPGEAGPEGEFIQGSPLNPEMFCVTWEQIPGRGAFEIQQETVFDNVAKASETEKNSGHQRHRQPERKPGDLLGDAVCRD